MLENVLNSMRVDKWLWAVRICKTRKLATEMCKKNKVLIDGQPLKPSRDIKSGQVIILKKDGIQWQYKVLQCLSTRVSAPVSLEYKKDITPKEMIERLSVMKKNLMPRRLKGSGRPTKKERRDLEILKENREI